MGKIGERNLTAIKRGNHVFDSFVNIEPYSQLLIRVKGTVSFPVVPSGYAFAAYVRLGIRGADQNGNCAQINVDSGSPDSGQTIAFECGTTAVKGWWLRQDGKPKLHYHMPEYGRMLLSITPDLIEIMTNADNVTVLLVQEVYGLKLQ